MATHAAGLSRAGGFGLSGCRTADAAELSVEDVRAD